MFNTQCSRDCFRADGTSKSTMFLGGYLGFGKPAWMSFMYRRFF